MSVLRVTQHKKVSLGVCMAILRLINSQVCGFESLKQGVRQISRGKRPQLIESSLVQFGLLPEQDNAKGYQDGARQEDRHQEEQELPYDGFGLLGHDRRGPVGHLSLI